MKLGFFWGLLAKKSRFAPFSGSVSQSRHQALSIAKLHLPGGAEAGGLERDRRVCVPGDFHPVYEVGDVQSTEDS